MRRHSKSLILLPLVQAAEASRATAAMVPTFGLRRCEVDSVQRSGRPPTGLLQHVSRPSISYLLLSLILICAVFPVPTVLNSFTKNSSPEQRFGFNYTDVHDCLIMDARSYTASSSSTTTSEWLSFSNNVAELVMRAAGCETLGSLLARERHLARERGELVTPKSSTKEVKLGKGSGGMRYAAFEETLVARELFREDF